MGIRRYLYIALISLCCAHGHAQDFIIPGIYDDLVREEVLSGVDILQQDPMLDFKYLRGMYLVYDCEDQHYVCTRKAEFQRCEVVRNHAIKYKHETLPCAYIQAFKDPKDCHKAQYQMMNASYQRLLCRPESKRYGF